MSLLTSTVLPELEHMSNLKHDQMGTKDYNFFGFATENFLSRLAIPSVCYQDVPYFPKREWEYFFEYPWSVTDPSFKESDVVRRYLSWLVSSKYSFGQCVTPVDDILKIGFVLRSLYLSARACVFFGICVRYISEFPRLVRTWDSLCQQGLDANAAFVMAHIIQLSIGGKETYEKAEYRSLHLAIDTEKMSFPSAMLGPVRYKYPTMRTEMYYTPLQSLFEEDSSVPLSILIGDEMGCDSPYTKLHFAKAALSIGMPLDRVVSFQEVKGIVASQPALRGYDPSHDVSYEVEEPSVYHEEEWRV